MRSEGVVLDAKLKYKYLPLSDSSRHLINFDYEGFRGGLEPSDVKVDEGNKQIGNRLKQIIRKHYDRFKNNRNSFERWYRDAFKILDGIIPNSLDAIYERFDDLIRRQRMPDT